MLKRDLRVEIERMIDRGICTFLSGMANGTDLWAAEEVLRQREKRPEVRLIAVIPYRRQASAWPLEHRKRYFQALEAADERVYISEDYTRDCIQKRNGYLVDHSDHMIAVYNGAPGGTRATLQMAQKKGLEIVTIPARTASGGTRCRAYHTDLLCH